VSDREYVAAVDDSGVDPVRVFLGDTESKIGDVDGVPVVCRFTAWAKIQSRCGNPSAAVTIGVNADPSSAAVADDITLRVAVCAASHHRARLRDVDSAFGMQRRLIELQSGDLAGAAEKHDRSAKRGTADLAQALGPAPVGLTLVLRTEVDTAIR
jgi:hypothetical protein